MRSSRLARLLIVAVSLGISCAAQILSVSKIKDAQAQLLQQQYISQLRELASEAAAVHFPYPFYFSEVLDIDEQRQKKLAQGSIHFERFNGQMVLEITGNYYASYSAAQLNGNQRARRTYDDVVLPLLKLAVAHIDRKAPIDAYAFEIAHHVRTKVLKVDTEGPENLTLIIPRAIAERLAGAKDQETVQAALLESAVYLNSEPLTLWLSGDDAPADVKDHYLARTKPAAGRGADTDTDPPEPGTLVSSRLIPESELAKQVREYRSQSHEVSPEKLGQLQAANQPAVERLLLELKEQAHFVEYAPPAFIAFHDGAYLQLNLNTQLERPAGSSQYRIAALAFDTHVSHLLRLVSKYFLDHPQFEGIDFSTTVHQPAESGAESVEFVVPFSALHCYAKYDCTGQELISRSIILINGERVTLDLQRAESDSGGGVR
jgi:hypothetical protein